MGKSNSPSTAVIALVVIAAVVALAGGFVGGRQETQQTETFEFVAEDHPIGEGVAVTKTESGGFSLFGVTVDPSEHFIRVAFRLPRSCQVGDAETWPISEAGCTGPAGLSGVISGSGIAITGNPIAFVDVAVDADCFGDVSLGAVWPFPVADCGASSS